jgi:threonine dehydrogenase-like Zn-dependent dehydrogenase
MDQYGHGRGTMHGGFCEFSLVKEKFCFVIETNISSDEAALLEPMGERE